MKIRTLIVKKDQLWQLKIKLGDKVLNSWTPMKLADAINIANTLGVHVDNIEALPLTQYIKQGAHA